MEDDTERISPDGNDANEERDLKPHPLQQAAMAGMLILILLSFTIANLHSILWVSSEWLVSTILPAVVTDATNKARAAEGRAPLVRDPLLDEAARLKAEDMARNGYFAHWSPTGVSPWHWFGEAGYRYVHAGENLAVHFTDSGAVVEAWLNSPTHRDNIMSGNYTEIGIGSAKGRYDGYDTVFVVQMFGTPAAPRSAGSAPVSAGTPQNASLNEPEAAGAPAVAGISESEESIGITEAGTVVYESFAATVAAGETLEQGSSHYPSPSFFDRVATSPRLVLQILYGLIGLFIVSILLVSIAIEWRRHHPVQLAYGFTMLAFMALLFQIHILITSNTLIA